MRTPSILLALCLISPLDAAKPYDKTPPPGVTIRCEQAYLAEGRSEKLDLYFPEKRSPELRSPAVVIIHGGGWVGGDKARKREFVTGTTLAKAGYVCASINYHLKSKGRWPANLHDCKNAVRWLRVNAEKLQIDPERIGVIGGSAGGHLALMVAYTGDDPALAPAGPYPGVSDRVSACVDMYGISNLLTRRTTTKDGTPTAEEKSHRLFPESRTEDQEKWKLASPVSHIGKQSPPTLILHGSGDTTVDRDQSKELHRALLAAGVESKLILVPGVNHAWPLKTSKFDYTDEVTDFFDKWLKRDPEK